MALQADHRARHEVVNIHKTNQQAVLERGTNHKTYVREVKLGHSSKLINYFVTLEGLKIPTIPEEEDAMKLTEILDNAMAAYNYESSTSVDYFAAIRKLFNAWIYITADQHGTYHPRHFKQIVDVEAILQEGDEGHKIHAMRVRFAQPEFGGKLLHYVQYNFQGKGRVAAMVTREADDSRGSDWITVQAEIFPA